eukprot:351091_1
MGCVMCTCCTTIYGNVNARRLLMIGLDESGKSTILYQLKLGEFLNIRNQIGFFVETYFYKNIEFTIWDIVGKDKVRPLWHHYYQNSQAIIYVIDSIDRERLNPNLIKSSKECNVLINGYVRIIEQVLHNKIIPKSIVAICYQYYFDMLETGSAKTELYKVLNDKEIEDDTVLLIYANKQDLPNAMSVEEIKNELELDKITNRKWHIQPCSALNGDGLHEGIDWIYNKLK